MDSISRQLLHNCMFVLREKLPESKKNLMLEKTQSLRDTVLDKWEMNNAILKFPYGSKHALCTKKGYTFCRQALLPIVLRG